MGERRSGRVPREAVALEMQMKLSAGEKQLIHKGVRPPFRVTRHWASLLNGEAGDPLRVQAVPQEAELREEAEGLADPLGEAAHSPLPRLVRRYEDRALVLVTGQCALYCRHCFRRRISGNEFGPISREDTRAIARWLKEHGEVKELLLSGGDPLTLPDHELHFLMRAFREARPDIVLRLATRMPVVEPRRITSALARLLGAQKPLWVVVQVNHPRELSPLSLRGFGRLQKQGLPVLNQSVLLRGVNDNIDVLEELCRALVSAGIKPYYLFQGDLAAGTAHFRLPLDEARALVDLLRERVSGLAMPVFAVDLPGGGGKVPLSRDYVLGKRGNAWHLKTPGGRQGLYPDPPPERRHSGVK